jgi:uncharacterized protein YqiB (DUF1249 family)
MILLSDQESHSRLQDFPGTFASLMDLYECNYINIRRLITVMPPSQIYRVSRVVDSLNLHLQVIERFRYTTELSLTYHFYRDTGIVAEPDLRIKVYHDARLAEVMSAQRRNSPGFGISAEGAKTELRARWRVNRFLYKWLSYCLHQGHRFGENV